MSWTPEREEQLAHMIEVEGLSYGLAAKLLNVTRNAAVGKGRRMDLERHAPSEERRKLPKLRDLLAWTAERYDVPPLEILGDRRTKRVVFARHVLCWLACNYTLYSIPQIGRFMNRDHTSVMHGRDRIRALVDAGDIEMPVYRPHRRGCPPVTTAPAPPHQIRRNWRPAPIIHHYTPKDVTAFLMGDPPPERSALAREAAE